MRPNLVVVGLGYIGLPTSVVFARSGLQVCGVDISPEVVESVNRGECPIVEPGLDEALRAAVESGRLTASVRPVGADAFIIAVPTPITADNDADMRFVRSAAEQIAPHLQQNDLVILESTSPVGATEQLAGWLAAARPDLQIASPGTDGSGAVAVAYCPERVLPGRILQELVDNDRLVGGVTAQCAIRAQELYAQVVTATCHMTTARTAELVKLTENAYRDVNIAFANELSIVGDELDVDVADVIALANLHPRVDILQPGPGVGGHCIAVDPWFIVGASSEARLIEMARRVNDSKPAWVVGKILERLDAQGHDDPIVGLLGMSYKPDVDDLRESPAIEVARLLAETRSVRLKIVEPHVDALPPALSSSAELVDLDRAIDDCHLIVGLVSHQAFRSSERLQAADPVRRLDFVSLLPG